MAKKDKAKKDSKPKKVIKKNVKKATKSKIKKKWVQIIAPKSFNSIPLGESLIGNLESLKNKSITANLMTLTNNMRNQSVEIRFDVIKVFEGKGISAVTGYRLLPSHLKRIVRRGRSKIGDSFVVRTATGRLVRIKPIVITVNHVSSSVATSIRLLIREKVKELLAVTSFDKLVQDMIGFKLQRALKDVVVKIHPVKSVEINACFLLPEGSSGAKEVSEDSRTEDFVDVIEPTSDEEKGSKTEESSSKSDDSALVDVSEGVKSVADDSVVDVSEGEKSVSDDSVVDESKKDESQEKQP